MWKYLAALLVVLLSLGGLVAAQDPCVDCYSNQINQNDIQVIDTVGLAIEDLSEINTVAVGNEGLSAAIIVAKAPVEPVFGEFFVAAPFARIDQFMNQRLTNLGSLPGTIDGAKGITWNKAIQAAWIANQGVKELEGLDDVTGFPIYVKEGALVVQSTTQLTDNVIDYDSREGGKVLNVDNKLAMIVDDMEATFNLVANADSTSTDSQASNGVVTNMVDVVISGTDP